uniref:NADH dehydrogenase [ubiquinone] 1 beta subcomplex subunit 6 n=1 Tax=Nothoprocta perdicaria TaxID=30464 RepID=A0A8C7EBS7_NOTPE
MGGYSADEKLRLQQLRVLRRRWLRDQELSEREPVLPPRRLGPVAAFWERFLQPDSLWRHQVFRLYRAGVFTVTRLLLPSWLALYYIKYHVMVSAARGDRILETGEIIPPLEEDPDDHH